ncbi:hypothetical protein WJX74_008933 [Apatococcus lobatus]|uniref:AB hydrolase-1 domain-containing protein n=2 Tax=Apatococcus TaxID=904362 RepID=A0AAW1TE42_9CHLO
MASPRPAAAGLKKVRPGREIYIRFTPGSVSGTFSKSSIGVILVHGSQGHHGQFHHQQKFLHKLGFTTIQYDLLGCGASSKPRPPNKASLIDCYCPASHYSDLEAILQLYVQALPRWILCGHSLGGPVAAELARRRPAEVIGLILLGCGIYPHGDSQRASTDPLPSFKTFGPGMYRRSDLALPFLQPFIAASLQLLFWHPLTFWRQPWLPLQAWFNVCTTRSWVLNGNFSAPPLPQANFKEYVDLFRSIKQPTLLIDKEQDAAGASGVQRMAADLADCCSFNVAGTGHYPHLERPETVNQLILGWISERVIAA